MEQEIKPASGRLGVLVVGVGGAVATTMITGTLASRKGLAKPIGSIAEMATMRMENNEEKLIKDIVPLANLNDIVFGGWDIFPDNAYEAAMYAEVLKEKDLNGVKDELEAIKPMPAAFDHNWAKRLNGTHIKQAATRWEMVEQLRKDIRDFKAANNCERIAVLWAASTEIYIPLSDEHMSLAALEKAMKENNTNVISPSMCYAYAAIAEGAPFIMGAPNLCVDTPAMWEFSKKMNVPIAGKDFKSGQTLMKTVLAPMFKTRSRHYDDCRDRRGVGGYGAVFPGDGSGGNVYEAVRCGEPGMPPGEERVGRNVESFEGRREHRAPAGRKIGPKVFQGTRVLEDAAEHVREHQGESQRREEKQRVAPSVAPADQPEYQQVKGNPDRHARDEGHDPVQAGTAVEIESQKQGFVAGVHRSFRIGSR